MQRVSEGAGLLTNRPRPYAKVTPTGRCLGDGRASFGRAAMEDVRIQWLALRTRLALGVKEEAPFEELLNRNDGEEAERILHFLNQTAGSAEEGAASAMFLSQELRLEEIDIEIGAHARAALQ